MALHSAKDLLLPLSMHFMNISCKKITTSVVLVCFIISNFSSATLYARNNQDTPHLSKKNENEKDYILKDTFSGNKLERVRASVKRKGSYKLLLRSSDGLNAINNFFDSEDKKIKVKQVGKTAYMVQFPSKTQSFSGELLKIENGIIPSKIGSYKVVQPEIVEALRTEYLKGETLDKLWNMEKI